MLPFLLKAKPQTGVMVKTRPEDETSNDESSNEEEDAPGIEVCAQDLLHAIEQKDIKGIAEALKSAFTILESQPHDENMDEGHE